MPRFGHAREHEPLPPLVLRDRPLAPAPDRLSGQIDGALTSLELDADLAAALAERFPDVEIVHGSATAVPFEDDSFSTVVCTTMLHHVPTLAEQDRLFAEARRVLADGGVFCGSDSLSTPVFRLAHRGDVMNVVDPEALPDRLRAAGFSDVAVTRGSDFFTFRAAP